ncbi:uncharacterized protein B0H64DRAFT_82332 [Chaetomium fimeti]|jgi:hypothetical protein|uniref:Uncharacterized protein n=1 Tax=Chaetomium fimeti TaxID=1854472 RepID=A0AAE0LV85_9PEZI|nr:hypothetical protein B0H64DRAFT_82332 [Chaetomium fimeti]
MSPQNSRHAYGVLLVALLSLMPAAHAQSACGLQGFSSCTDGDRTTGYGCCPTGWDCYATECSSTGTPTLPVTATTTACPGIPAHHLCPLSLGGNCCYRAYACDPDNVSECILTQTERVFDEVVSSMIIIGNDTQEFTSTTIFYPWPTITPRMTPEPVAESKTDSKTTTAPTTTTTTTAPTEIQATSTLATGAAGHVEAHIGVVIGGIVAGLLVQN